jgi:IS30 family transposase
MSQIDSTTKKKKFEHLNLGERKTIERMLKLGRNVKDIAEVLGRNKSSIRREIKRGSVNEYKVNPYISKDPNYPTYVKRKVYYSDEGRKVYEEHRKKCCWEGKQEKNKDLIKFVEDKVKGKWGEKLSPDAALGDVIKKGVFTGQYISTKTFYNLVDKGKLEVKNWDLLRKIGRKPRKQGNTIKKHKKKLGKSIEERPANINTREEFGHWEGDFIVGKDKKSYLFTLVERKYRVGLIFKIESRESVHVVKVIDMLQEKYGKYFKDIFKTITFDNGQEFSDSASMEKDGRINVYYAHPYSSYERGSNENWNGLVRRFYPKGSCFMNLTKCDIEKLVNRINTMPRKILGYKSSLELWEMEINAIMLA